MTQELKVVWMWVIGIILWTALGLLYVRLQQPNQNLELPSQSQWNSEVSNEVNSEVNNVVANNPSDEVFDENAKLLSKFLAKIVGFHSSKISDIRTIPFTRIFDQGDGWKEAQGFEHILSNCHLEPNMLEQNKEDFQKKLAIASLGNKTSTVFVQDIQEDILDIQRLLSQINSKRIYFLYGKKKELFNNTLDIAKPFWPNIYMIIAETDNEKWADFSSTQLNDNIENWGKDYKKHYNVAFLDVDNKLDFVSKKSHKTMRALLWDYESKQDWTIENRDNPDFNGNLIKAIKEKSGLSKDSNKECWNYNL